MTDNIAAAAAGRAPAGRMLFYKQPELLNHQAHGSLGLKQPARPFEFARKAKALPLTLGEIATAQRYFPVIFSDLDNPVPLAVVGTAEDQNLFVDDDGRWDPATYVPAYARCYPFALAAKSEEEFAVVIDRAADSISDDPDQPFFDGDKVTPETQALIDFCGRFDVERKRAAEFGKRLKELGLLVRQQATRTAADGTETTIASYVGVDREKLATLGADVVKELFDKGYLAAVFAHAFSLENWRGLMDRNLRRMSTTQ